MTSISLCGPSLSRRNVLLAGLLALLLSLPSLGLGFVVDDYMLLGTIENWYGLDPPAVNLYATWMSAPSMPWWRAPDTDTLFWRPLSSALVRLDHALFHHTAWPYHVHGLLWLLAFMGVVGLLYARLPRRMALPALFLVAAEEAHAFTSGIVCNRHAVVAAVLGFLGLYLHLRWREDGRRSGLPLSALAFGASLLAGETALAVMAYVLAYELFGARDGLRTRLLAIAPAAVLSLGYVVAYAILELGARGNHFYLDPVGAPGAFAAGLAQRVPAMLAGGLVAFPANLWMAPGFKLPLVTVGVVTALAFAALLWRLRKSLPGDERRALSWWIPGALGSILPVAMAPPADRQLLVPTVGLALLVGLFMALGWRAWRSADAAPSRRILAAVGLLLLVAGHFGVASASRIAQQQGPARLDDRLEEAVSGLEDMTVGASAEEPHHVVVLAAADFVTAIYPSWIYDLRYGPGVLSWSALSMAPFEHRWTRTGPRTFELEPVGGQLLGTFGERTIRGWDRRLRIGDVVERPLFDVEILEIGDLGPTRISVDFKVSPESPRMHFVTWRGGTLREVPLPAVGETVVVERATGVGGIV